jgi:uncharacterized MAPEG superfamily protein
MHKLIRGVITGTLIGAGVGVAMLVMRNRNQKMMAMARGPRELNERSRGTIRMVKDNAMRWTSAVKSGTEAFSRKLAQRTS